jgi:hypothetical protein
MLSSKLLSGNQRLRECEVSDPAHVVPGASGEHVRLIQMALFMIERADIDTSEVDSSSYGPSTAAAVLSYKTDRGIVNLAYQRTADNIVGKMTIKCLDTDMLAVEAATPEGFDGRGLRPTRGRFT